MKNKTCKILVYSKKCITEKILLADLTPNSINEINNALFCFLITIIYIYLTHSLTHYLVQPYKNLWKSFKNLEDLSKIFKDFQRSSKSSFAKTSTDCKNS